MLIEYYTPTMKDEQMRNTNQAETDNTSAADKKHVPQLKLLALKMLWWLRAHFPNTIPNPYGDYEDAIRKFDAECNAKSTIDENVSLRLNCMMVSEIFGPNEIESLYKGIDKIGWNEARDHIHKDTIIDWLKKYRLYGHPCTRSLGRIASPEISKIDSTVDLSAKFPKDFTSLIVNLSQLTHSITCLSVGFVFSDDASLEYSDAINRAAKSIRIPDRSFGEYKTLNVINVKEDRVRYLREKYQNIAISWLSDHFPGFFSKYCKNSHFPTVEFLSFNELMPFDLNPFEDQSWLHWSHFVNIGNHINSWKSTSDPSLGFAINSDFVDKLPNHMTVTIRLDLLSEDELERCHIESLYTQTNFAYSQLEPIIDRCVLEIFLRELLRRLKETCRSLSKPSKKYSSVNQIEKICTFFRDSIGIPSIAHETLALSKDRMNYALIASEFFYQQTFDKEINIKISDRLHRVLGQLSQQLLVEDQNTREFLDQLASSINTKESIAAQRIMICVSLLTLVVCGATLLMNMRDIEPRKEDDGFDGAFLSP